MWNRNLRQMKTCIEMPENLSKNVSWKEVVYSNTAIRHGIDNTPDLRQILVINHMANNFIQPLRNELKVPLKFNSIYRSKQLNKKVGGSKTSDHMVLGDVAAVDIDDVFSLPKGVSNRDIFLYIYDNMDFYKLIWEYEGQRTKKGERSPAWVHVSYSTDEKKNEERIVLFIDGNGTKPFNFTLI